MLCGSGNLRWRRKRNPCRKPEEEAICGQSPMVSHCSRDKRALWPVWNCLRRWGSFLSFIFSIVIFIDFISLFFSIFIFWIFQIIKQKDGRSRGFAFVTMSSGEEAQAVIDKFNLQVTMFFSLFVQLGYYCFQDWLSFEMLLKEQWNLNFFFWVMSSMCGLVFIWVWDD